MATFNMQGQQVDKQINVGRDINMGAEQSLADILSELQELKVATADARRQGLLSSEVATDVEYQLVKATQQAEKEPSNKTALLEHLNRAKSLVEGIAAASGIVTGLATLMQTIQKFF